MEASTSSGRTALPSCQMRSSRRVNVYSPPSTAQLSAMSGLMKPCESHCARDSQKCHETPRPMAEPEVMESRLPTLPCGTQMRVPPKRSWEKMLSSASDISGAEKVVWGAVIMGSAIGAAVGAGAAGSAGAGCGAGAGAAGMDSTAIGAAAVAAGCGCIGSEGASALEHAASAPKPSAVMATAASFADNDFMDSSQNGCRA